MKWLLIITFTLISLSCSSNNLKSAERLLYDKVIIASKTNDSNNLSDVDYDQISEYISQGKSRWIELYPILNRSPFLGATSFQEGLNISMAYALPKNPLKILKFVDKNNVGYICGAPFIEPTQDEVDDYFSQASMALKNLSPGGQWKNECIFNLNKSVANGASVVQ
jgi:hypothetical protein